ncbi:MAG: ferritin-like domain-containing protein [Ilumatobacteraceae bacterium]|nr:ferritin-like domain-containing protein [Ilumatobacteraceae bacterium]
MSLDSAEPTSSRRALFGTAGAAGVAAAIAALSTARPVAAAPPFSPTAADTALLRQAMELELAARDLYETTLAAGISDDVSQLIELLASNHNAYAKGIAGIAGLSADTPNQEVFDQFEADFDTTDVEAWARAANSLENTAAATHTELMALYEAENAITFTASVVMVEARAGVVTASIAGDSLEGALTPDAAALELSGEASS